MTRTSGVAGPLVLAPAEGVGALRAPCHCGSMGQQTDFLPTPLAGAWVNRWTFLFPFPSHLKLFVSVRYKKMPWGAWVFGCVCHLVVVLLLLFLHTSNFLFLLGTENSVGCMGPWLCMPSF